MLRLDMHMIAGVLQYVAVASFAEAWIENHSSCYLRHRGIVASFAEAWIENKFTLSILKSDSQSPPSRRRGLKKK